MLVAERVEGSYNKKTAYMSLTMSTKLKAKKHKVLFSKYSEADKFLRKSMELLSEDSKSTAGSNPSFNLSSDLYPPMPLGRFDEMRNQGF